MGKNSKSLSLIISGLTFTLILTLGGGLLENKISLSKDFKVIAENFNYFLYNEETLSWKLKASLFIQTSDDSFAAENIEIVNPLRGITLTSKKATYLRNEEKIIFKEKVLLVTSEFGEVYTDELIYFPKKNLILSNSDVLVKKRDLQIRGKGLVYQIDTQNFEVKGRAQVKMSF